MDYCQQLKQKRICNFHSLNGNQMEQILKLSSPLGGFAEDMLITFCRSLTFFEDQNFCRAILENTALQSKAMIWRLHIGSQLALFAANHLQGSLVECGCGSKAIYASTIVKYLKYQGISKEYHLYDSFTGIPENRPESKTNLQQYKFRNECYEHLINLFDGYNNVHIHKGDLPATIKNEPPGTEGIAFLHIDLCNYSSDRDVIKYLLEERCFSPWAIVLFEAHGWKYYGCHKIMEDDFIKDRKLNIIEIPTGHGIMIVPPGV